MASTLMARSYPRLTVSPASRSSLDALTSLTMKWTMLQLNLRVATALCVTRQGWDRSSRTQGQSRRLWACTMDLVPCRICRTWSNASASLRSWKFTFKSR